MLAGFITELGKEIGLVAFLVNFDLEIGVDLAMKSG